MKLSDILQQKLMIDSWDVNEELRAFNQKLSLIKTDIEAIDVDDFKSDVSVVEGSINDMVHDLTELQANIEHLRSHTAEVMNVLASGPLSESYDMYDERKNWFNKEKAAETRENDQFKDFDEYIHRFDTFVSKFASWKYPTLYIRPNSTHFFDSLKASDTLYVMEQCDITDWLKENLSEQYYKRSVRFKLIDENKDTFIAHQLPSEQMGLIVMENFLTFKPLEIIRQYLNESMELLKPGGHLMFTYNNCDLPSGARNFENGMYCYTPGRMLRLICEASGFEVVDDTASDRVSWFVLKKPGELTSLKGGKCLGQIMDED